MDTTRKLMRRIIPGQAGQDKLTAEDLAEFDIGKSILVDDTWYTIRRQDKDRQMFQVSVADFEPNAGENLQWVEFDDIARLVNEGKWGFQHTDETRGRQGWFGKESPRHEGRHDKF